MLNKGRMQMIMKYWTPALKLIPNKLVKYGPNFVVGQMAQIIMAYFLSITLSFVIYSYVTNLDNF